MISAVGICTVGDAMLRASEESEPEGVLCIN